MVWPSFPAGSARPGEASRRCGAGAWPGGKLRHARQHGSERAVPLPHEGTPPKNAVKNKQGEGTKAGSIHRAGPAGEEGLDALSPLLGHPCPCGVDPEMAQMGGSLWGAPRNQPCLTRGGCGDGHPPGECRPSRDGGGMSLHHCTPQGPHTGQQGTRVGAQQVLHTEPGDGRARSEPLPAPPCVVPGCPSEPLGATPRGGPAHGGSQRCQGRYEPCRRPRAHRPWRCRGAEQAVTAPLSPAPP